MSWSGRGGEEVESDSGVVAVVARTIARAWSPNILSEAAKEQYMRGRGGC